MPSGYITKFTTDKVIVIIGGLKVNMEGVVTHKFDDAILGKVVIEGMEYVKVPNFPNFSNSKDGYCTLANIVALAYKPIFLPEQKLMYVFADFIDGDKRNIHPSNLVWRFTNRIESTLKGFYYIPGYTRYLARRDGVVISSETYKAVPQYTGPNDYVMTELRPDTIKGKPINKRSVAVALTFCDYPGNVMEYVVNHIDGVKSNDAVDNLEWISNAENLRHSRVSILLKIVPPRYTYVFSEYDAGKSAELFRKHGVEPPTWVFAKPTEKPLSKRPGLLENKEITKLTKITCLDIETGVFTQFKSQADCCRVLDILPNQIYQSINSVRNEEAGIGLVKGRYIFRTEEDDFPLLTPMLKSLAMEVGGTRVRILVKNYSTGVVGCYDGVRTAARELGLKPKALFMVINTNTQCIPYTTLLAKTEDCDIPWIK